MRTRKEYLKTLYRRVECLKKRIENSDKDLSFDKAELGSLEWILERERFYFVMREVQRKPSERGQE